MRSEERHKMHRNELADWLYKNIERVKPYSHLMSLSLLLGVLVVLASIWWVRRSSAEAAYAWDGVYRGLATGNPSALEGVVSQHAGTDVALWAAVVAGDMHLSRGCLELFENKSVASDELRKAIERYRTVQNEARSPAVLERATFGLARAYEALAGTRQSQGELDKAIQAYEEVVRKWPDGAYAATASRRLEDVNREETKAFYDRFAAFDPQPAPSGGPAVPGSPPSFDSESLPSEASFPDLLGSQGPEDSESEPAAPEGDSSATMQPQEPAAAEPGDETPAAEPAPSEEASASPPGAETAEPAKPEATPAEKPAPSEQPAAPEAAGAEESDP